MIQTKNKLFKLLGAGIISAFLTVPLKVLSSGVSGEVTSTATSSTSQINIFEALVLGIVQGLTEFLPISSSAHLKVVPVILNWGDPGVAFTAIIQLGSIGAVLWYFWSDLTKISKGVIKAIRTSDYQSNDFRLAVGIGLGTIPILFFGLLIKKFIPDYDNSPLRSMAAIACASILMGLLLGIAEQIGQCKRNFDQLNVLDGILMGLAQAMALIPGVSRSGSTITAGLFIGLERATAARFSFLLGIPAITLAGLVELKDAIETGFGNASMASLIVGTLSAAVFSYLSIAWLIRYLQNQNTWVFVWYRVAFGVAILGAIATGLMDNI